jgi:hypothetical protein
LFIFSVIPIDGFFFKFDSPKSFWVIQPAIGNGFDQLLHIKSNTAAILKVYHKLVITTPMNAYNFAHTYTVFPKKVIDLFMLNFRELFSF